MIKKIVLVSISMLVLLTGLAAVMYLRNTTPTVPVISSLEAADSSRPYVVKLHACPVCIAKRLGLEKFFDENFGWTGTISVLDGRTKKVTTSIHGSRDFDEYRAAIDASLKK
jgi:hypothetical protein